MLDKSIAGLAVCNLIVKMVKFMVEDVSDIFFECAACTWKLPGCASQRIILIFFFSPQHSQYFHLEGLHTTFSICCSAFRCRLAETLGRD